MTVTAFGESQSRRSLSRHSAEDDHGTVARQNYQAVWNLSREHSSNERRRLLNRHSIGPQAGIDNQVIRPESLHFSQ
jgi:hypothetical protein